MGSFIEQNLAKGEKIVYETSPHWMIFVGGTILFAFGLPLLFEALLLWIHPSNDQTIADVGMIACLVIGGTLSLIGFFVGLSDFLRFETSEYAVTNKRIVFKLGVLNRRIIETQLGKIESLTVQQGIFGRIFDYGTVYLTYTGGSGESFDYVAKPFEFKKQIENQSG